MQSSRHQEMLSRAPIEVLIAQKSSIPHILHATKAPFSGFPRLRYEEPTIQIHCATGTSIRNKRIGTNLDSIDCTIPFFEKSVRRRAQGIHEIESDA